MENNAVKKIFTLSVLSAALLSVTTAGAATQHVNILSLAGSAPVNIQLNDGSHKTVKLLGVNLSAAARKKLLNNMMFTLAHPTVPGNSMLPPKTDLGMNNVPVLDQGPWGTCVTFANSGALDAFYLLKGDETVSQLCSLELGKTLQVLPETDGGWDGSLGKIVLDEFSKYGYITQAWQKKNGCGGLNEYPVYFNWYNGHAMPESLYVKNSIKTFASAGWETLLDENDNPDIFNPQQKDQLVDTIKQNLASGYRVTFGVLLDTSQSHDNVGGNGYVNGVKSAWLLTDQIVSDIKADNIGGHEMIITGYDDNACATYTDPASGKEQSQCGLFTLRNSWGALAGDKGNYYMSYDYFKNLAVESYVIGKSS